MRLDERRRRDTRTIKTSAHEIAGHPSFRATSEAAMGLAQDGIRLWWAALSARRLELRQARFRAYLPKPCIGRVPTSKIVPHPVEADFERLGAHLRKQSTRRPPYCPKGRAPRTKYHRAIARRECRPSVERARRRRCICHVVQLPLSSTVRGALLLQSDAIAAPPTQLGPRGTAYGSRLVW